MDAVVLAGGYGTRLRSVVSDVPKPMAPVAGRPFLERLLEYWIAQGVRRFVLSVGYLADKVSSHFGPAWGGASIAYAHETEPLGTGGGLLLAAAEARGEDLLVLNGDTWFAVGLPGFAAFHRERGADCSLSLFRSNDPKRYLGLRTAADGRVDALEAVEGGLANGGVYLFRRAALQALPWSAGQKASLEADMLPHGLRSGWRVYGRECDAPFIDIGVPDDYRRAPEILAP